MNLDLDSILSSDHVLIAGTVAAIAIFMVLFIIMARERRWGAVTVLILTGFGMWWLFLWLGIAVLILPFVLLAGFFDGIQERIRNGRRQPVYKPKKIIMMEPRYPTSQNTAIPPDGSMGSWGPSQVQRVEYVPVEIEIPWQKLIEAEEMRRKAAEPPKPTPWPTPPAKPLPQSLFMPPADPRPEPKQSPLYWDD